MNNFTFNIPTDIRFGRNQIQCLPEELAKYGRKVLLVYGGGSIKRNGIYDKVYELLKDFQVFELSGIEPNPKLTSVEKVLRYVRKRALRLYLPWAAAVLLTPQSILPVQPAMRENHGILSLTEAR